MSEIAPSDRTLPCARRTTLSATLSSSFIRLWGVETPSFRAGRKRLSPSCSDLQKSTVECEYGQEHGEAGVQVPLLSHGCAGRTAVAHLRVRAPGLQPRSGRTHHGLVPPAAADHLQPGLGRAHRVEEGPLPFAFE